MQGTALGGGARVGLRAWGVVCAATALAACGARRADERASALRPLQNGIDFGAAGTGTAVTRSLELLHRGPARAVVAGARIEPDDGTWRVREAPRAVSPGETARLRVTWEPLQPGPATATLRVTLADGSSAAVALQGRAVDARAEISAAPAPARAALGEARRRVLVLRNGAETPVTARLQVTGPDAAEFEAPGAVTVPPLSEAAATLRWEPRGRAGARRAALELTACPLCLPRRVALDAEAFEHALHLSADALSFEAGRLARAELWVTNTTDAVATLAGVHAEDGTDPGFRVEAPTPRRLPPFESARIAVAFAPVHAGPARGRLLVRAEGEEPRAVALAAEGPAERLSASPSRLDFGRVPAGRRGEERLVVSYRGVEPAAPMRVRVEASGEAFSLPEGARTLDLAPGEHAEVRVAFRPGADGDWTGTLALAAQGGGPRLEVALAGSAGAAQRCRLRASPSALHFGAAPLGRPATLGVRVTNAGDEACSVWGARTEGDGAFSVRAAADAERLAPGASLVQPVTFSAPAPGRRQARLRFETDRKDAPFLEIPLTGGTDGRPCLRPEPPAVHFAGDEGPREIAWRNTCAKPVRVDAVRAGAGTDDRLALLAPPLPATLAPDATLQATVRFAPGGPGRSFRPLYARGSDSPLGVLLAAVALADDPTRHDERFVQAVPGRLDLLLVLDNSASMKDEREALERSVLGFLARADAAGLDYRIATTTTGLAPAPRGAATEACPGGAAGGEAGALFPADGARPRVVTPRTPARAAVLRENLRPGGCGSLEQGLSAAQRALAPAASGEPAPPGPRAADAEAGFLRPDATLAVVLWSDEDDQSPGPVDEHARRLQRLRPAPLRLAAVVAPAAGCPGAVEPGLRYLEATRALGGRTASVCEADWGGLLDALAEDARRVRTRFPLATAAEPGTLEVAVDDRRASGWRYDAASRAVVFDEPPAPGARVRVAYREPPGGS